MKTPDSLIFRTHDEFGEISVHETGDRRTLYLGSKIEQSAISKRDPARLLFNYTRGMILSLLFQPEPKDILILGLGGGSLAHTFLNHFPQCRITAIEYRQAVIDVAREWFYLPEDGKLHIHCMDAVDYICCRPMTSDLIFADLYFSDGMNDTQADEGFITQCHDALNPGGLFVANTWRQGYEFSRQLSTTLHRCFDDQVLHLAMDTGADINFGFRTAIPHPDRKSFFHAAEKLGVDLDSPIYRFARDLWNQNNVKLCGR